jgi:hypothetical protein
LVTSSAWQTFADLLDPPENPYVRDPVGWVTSTLGEFWWSGQHRVAQSVVENRYSAFKASHDVSKSHTMSRLALWWIDVHPPGEAFVVTTGQRRRVEAILSRYGATPTQRPTCPAGSLSMPSGTSETSSSRTAANRPTTTRRLSRAASTRYVLVIIDEAGGVPSRSSTPGMLWPPTSTLELLGRQTGRSGVSVRDHLQAWLRLARRDAQRLRHPGVHRSEGPGGAAAVARLT